MKPRRCTFLLVAVTLVVTFGVSWPAAAEFVTATLRGSEEVPSISTTGTGAAFGFIAEGDSSAFLFLSYAGLGSVTGAHIHLGQSGVNGGIVIHLCGTGGKPACPPAELSIDLTMADVVALPDQGVVAGDLVSIVQAMRSGAAYVNIHTSVHPGGEIRGQIE